MQYARGHIPVLKSAFYESERQVDVLTIHEEILVERTHLVYSRASEHAESAAHHLYPFRSVPRQITHIIMCEASALGKTRAQTRHLVETRHWRRYAPSRLHSVGTVTLSHPHPHSSRSRMFIHEVYHVRYGVFADNGVRVEQQHIFSAASSDGKIVRARESEIAVAAYHPDFRETA